MMNRKTYRWGIRAIALSLVCYLSPTVTNAAPYACELSNNGGAITFRLNEDAHNVKIIANGGATVFDLGALPRGLNTTTDLGITGVYQVAVTRSAPPGYTQSTTNTFQDQNGVYVNKFENARGVVVNQHPETPSFGRIYIANTRTDPTSTEGVARAMGQGIYAINSDDTVALDTGFTPRTAGLAFSTGSSSNPFHLTIGKDDGLLYICDDSDDSGGLWYTDLDVTTGGSVFSIGDTTVTPSANHGSIYSAVVEGSLASNNLTVYTYDEDLAPVKSAWRYDIGSGPLPFSGTSNLISSGPMINAALKLVKGGVSNYIYGTQLRTSGTDGPTLRIFTTAGVELTNSLSASRAYLNNGSAADLLRDVTALDISPDGKTLALLRGSAFGTVLLLPISTNGLFDPSDATNTANSFSLGTLAASDNNRDIAYDAAGNLHVINTANEWFRIYSRGGPTIATTGSDGTFTTGVPQNLITVAATTANTLENSATNGVFTLTRSTATNSLAVNFTLTGTAVNGADYASVATNVTFNIGQTTATVTIAPINNATPDLKRTVVLTIATSGSYSAGIPGAATVTILDDETPTISIDPVQPKLLEGYSASKATFTVTRKGLVAPALTIPLSYPGTAIAGTHFTGPSSVSIDAGVQTATVTLTPIDDEIYQGDRFGFVQLNGGAGYNLATNSAAAFQLIDDELPTGSVFFSDNLTANSSANWTSNSSDSFSTANTHADFNFDYSTLYVPKLPGSANTRALRLQVTNAVTEQTAVSVSPLGLNLGTNDYRMRFKMWINYNGPMPDGGSGSTYHLTAGAGTTADHVNVPSNPFSDGTWFAMDGDGGTHGTTSGDCNAYVGASLQQDDSGVYASGTTGDPRVTTNAYYAVWGGLTAPANQLSNFSGQTGTSDAGNLGISWHTVTVTKTGNTVTWHIDGVLIATADGTGATGPNVFVGYADLFPGDSGTPAMSFALVNNFKVSSYVAAPAPASAPAIVSSQKLGNTIQLIFTGASSDLPSDFTVLGSSTLSSSSASYTPVGGQTIIGGNGGYMATLPVTGATQFYRIKR